MQFEANRDGGSAADARPVVVIGAAGQLGEAMTATLAARWPTVPLARRDLDLDDVPAVRETLSRLRPWAIVNCAGFNDVDGAEDRAPEALAANAFAVRTLARAARGLDAAFVHYSSDFVFDGEAERPYLETDAPNPRSTYAASKLLGEWFAADAPAHYILRVESLFGGLTRRKSSLDRIVAAIAAGQTVRVFVDRVVTPSYVFDISDATVAVLAARPAAGVYHCVNSGAATWHEVAREIRGLLGTDATLEEISTREVTLRAARPRYCALDNGKLRAAAYAMPSWQDALRRALTASGTERN